MTKKLRNARQQRGLSFVEFVGCLCAMTGGVLIGSLYLGIDVQQMAVGVLEQAQIVKPGYFTQTRGDGEISSQENLASTTSQGESQGTEDLSAGVATASGGDQSNDSTTETNRTLPETTSAERLAATRTYWDQLTSCMLAEARGRAKETGNPEEWQLYDYLTRRKQGHQKALETLAALDSFAVDERLLTHGEQVVSWHKSGVKLFEHALSLLTDGPGAELSGPFAQSWQSAATQLRMEESLVIDRHIGVANYLDREYAEDAPFVPAFQQ